MFDLDAAESLPEYEVKFQGKVHHFDTILLIRQIATEIAGVTDPAVIRDKVNKVFGLGMNTTQALQILHDFDEFSTQYESLVKKLFGHTPSSSTTTESVPTSSSDSSPESDMASSETSKASTPSA